MDHHHRRLPQTLAGALHPGISRPPTHIFVQPGEFWGSSVSSDLSSHSGSVKGSYLPSAFVTLPVGIEQVEDI